MDADFNFLSTEGDSEVVKRNCRKIISILGAHKVALWFYDGSTNSIGFSDDFFKNLGLEEVGIQYDTYEGFIHSVHPNDVVNYLNAFHSIMSGAEQMLKVRFRTIGKNEQTLWFEDSLFTCLECKDASAPRIIGYRTNITNRVEEEDKFEYLKEYSKKIIDALPEFIFIFDDKYYIVDVIIPLKTKLFHTREELIGQPLRRFFEPEISDLYERTIRECLANDEIVEVESFMEFNGVRFYFQAKVSSFGANQVIWVVRDITDKVKHIEALELMRKRADEAERLKRAFLASMSHDFNLIRHGGKIVFIGLYIGELVIEDPTFHKKETTLLSSRNATREDFALVIELMRSNKIHENLMKNQAFNFFSVGEDYQRNVVENKNMVKGVITF